MIAALYVQTGGAYYGLPDVDPWDEARDARRYAGPHAVVAHPPCARWGRYWYGSPSSPTRYEAGDDGGCFASALASVRQWGGVLEHPAGSKAWAASGLVAPSDGGGWTVADFFGGWTCRVDQGQYGHRAAKPTWLYAVGIEPPSLDWSRTERWPDVMRYGDRAKAVRRGEVELMSKRERAATPTPFRDLLLSIAATAAARRAA